MPDSPERLALRMQSEGEKTVAYFRALDSEAYSQKIYETGSAWTVRQILAHFVSTELGFTDLIQNILAGGAGAPEDFDIDRYNEKHVADLEAAEPGDLLLRFQAARDVNIQMVGGLLPSDLERQGRHPFLGIVALEEIIKLLYRHIQIHLRDVRRADNPA
jgi:hypothetical protein